MFRFLVRLAVVATALALVTAPAAAFNETGGSGLVRTEEAYSLPIGRPLFSIYAGAFSNNFTPGTSRMISATPSVTLGLGGGFEGSVAMALEGLTSSIDGGSFDRRFDFRRRGVQTKLRWTTDLGSPRLRAGILGNLTLPLWIDERPGALVDPADNRDVGVMGLVSTNLGWFDVPVRLHLNAGYWWSRNDGAFIYRGLPTAIPVTGVAANGNDVVEYGLAVEAGLRRAVVFVELRSEQFVDARSALSSRENLWQVTPGFKTQLSSTVGLTGGIAFDISANDEGTAFDPATAYPEYELKLGLTLGSVLSREHHEVARRQDSRRSVLASTPPQAQAAAAPLAAPVTEPVVAAAPLAAPVVTQAPVITEAMRIKELEERLARIETAQRLAYLEARLAALEGRSVLEVPVATVPAAVPAAKAAVVDSVTIPPAAPTPAPATAAPAAKATMPAPTAEETPPVAAAAAPADEASVVSAEVAAPAAAAAAPADEASVVPAEVAAPAAAAAAPADEAGVVPAEVAVPAAAAAAPADEAGVVPAEVAAPAATVTPEIQARLELMQREIQALREEQAARLASSSPATDAGGTQDRATVITSGGGSQMPSVVAVPVPMKSASEPTAAASAPTTGMAADTLAAVKLLPELLEPYRPAEPAAAAEAPAASPSATVAAEAPALAEAVIEPRFGLEVGARHRLAGVDVMAAAPLAAAAARAELDSLAAELAAWPGARVALLVHGGDSDHARALARSDSVAVLIHGYLVAAGAPQGNVIPIGMGLSESAVPAAEVERIR